MANISLTLAAGSVTSPYYYDVRISKQLCCKTSKAPVFVPIFSLVSYGLVGGTTTDYEAVVNVQGIVTYTPCGACCAKTQTVNETIVIPFYSETTPASVSISAGRATNTLTNNGCCSNCSNTFVSEVPINLTITAQA